MNRKECRVIPRDTWRLPAARDSGNGDNLIVPGFALRAPPRRTPLRSARRDGSRKWLDGVSDALCISPPPLQDLRPLRHCGDTHAPTPTRDYPPRATRFHGGQRRRRPRCARRAARSGAPAGASGWLHISRRSCALPFSGDSPDDGRWVR